MPIRPVNPETYFHGPVWDDFGLSYSSYLVLPRTLLCAMPTEWQERFVGMMDEMRATFDASKLDDNYHVALRGEDGRFRKDGLANYRHPMPLPFREAGE